MQSINNTSARVHAEAVFSNTWSTVLQFELPVNYTAIQISISILSFMEIRRFIFTERYYTIQSTKEKSSASSSSKKKKKEKGKKF